MAIDTYALLTAAINSWSERGYASSQTDDFISLAESEFDLSQRGFQGEATATITLTNGVGALPVGFKTAKSLIYSTYAPMEQVTWDALAALNPSGAAGIPNSYAISGTTLKVAPLLTGDVSLMHELGLTGLSASNTSNWLLVKAPQAYLWMCRAMQLVFEEDFTTAAGFQQQAMGVIDRINVQSDVARFGNAAITMPMVTP